LHALLQKLIENGFVRTDLVGEAGEFAFRGGILDLFSATAPKPVRVELLGDTIDSLRWFDVETQRSEEPSGPVTLLPMTQFALDRDMRAALARRLSLDFNDLLYKRDLAEKIDRLNENGTFPGIEHYLPVAAPSVTFAQYISGDDWSLALVEPDQITTTIAKYEALLRAEYEAASEKGRAAYPPEKLVVPGTDVLDFISNARLAFAEVHIGGPEFDELRLSGPSVDRYTNRLSEFTGDLTKGHAEGRRQILFTATKGGREKVERLLREFGVPFADGVPPPTSAAHAGGFRGATLGTDLLVTSGNLARGFALDEINLTAYSEWDLFEPPTSTRVGSRKKKTDAFITDLRDLKLGDFIVHVDHGVGRYVGLQRIPFGDTEREVMEIEYSSGGKLLMPMENLNLIQKYSGGADAPPKLDKLGGTAWARTKDSVKKAMRDMADELLKLYATRQMVQGHSFSKDSPWQFEFEEAFEFDETEDQVTAIDDVKSDMESRKPMDRLLCGDVGYGKTEVAMR
ncbi:MAG TPA: CarD family transcriptional regulator, partial [Thermoanaerobaculia bacterium]